MISQKKDAANRKPWWWAFGAAGGFLLAKIKAILPLLKLGTLGGAILSMFVSIGAYAIIAPLKLSICVVLLVLVHELGHVGAAHRKGLPTSAPVFIPLIGALVNMKRHPRDAATEAYIALAGPIVGTIGALAALAGGWFWTSPLLIASAYIGLLLNLINLLPIFPLDGGKIVIAVSRWLWLLGLVVGLAVIGYFRFYTLIAVWLVFAFDLLRKALRRFGKPDRFTTWSSFLVPEAPLREKGMEVPGAGFSLDVPFTTYSELEGKQKVEVLWEEVGLRGVTSLPVPAIVLRCRAVRVDRRRRDRVDYWMIRCQVDYEVYQNDAYYDVPALSRWLIGLVYVLLASFLFYMTTVVAGIGMPDGELQSGTEGWFR